MKDLVKDITFSEYVLIFSGIFILCSVGIVYSTANFELWVVAKALYVAGVLFLLFEV